jgi:Skp family chaperone for outer membrane proteins
MKFKLTVAALALAVLPIAVVAQSTPPADPAAAEKLAAREKVRAACASDVQKFCANIERAKGAMRACLEANQSQLSQDCRSAREERAAARAKDKS